MNKINSSAGENTSPHSGICPACSMPIARTEFTVLKKFKCPRCQRLLQTAKHLRILAYVFCVWAPIPLAWYWGGGILKGVLLYPILIFVFSMVYSVVVTGRHLPRLMLAEDEPQEFQTLNLNK